MWRGLGDNFGLVFFFNTLIHNEIVFFEYMLACYFFRLQNSAGIFFVWMGLKKVGIPLLLLATLAAVLFNSNRGLILASMQFTMKFFSSSMCLHVIFFASRILQVFFLCGWG